MPNQPVRRRDPCDDPDLGPSSPLRRSAVVGGDRDPALGFRLPCAPRGRGTDRHCYRDAEYCSDVLARLVSGPRARDSVARRQCSGYRSRPRLKCPTRINSATRDIRIGRRLRSARFDLLIERRNADAESRRFELPTTLILHGGRPREFGEHSIIGAAKLHRGSPRRTSNKRGKSSTPCQPLALRGFGVSGGAPGPGVRTNVVAEAVAGDVLRPALGGWSTTPPSAATASLRDREERGGPAAGPDALARRTASY